MFRRRPSWQHANHVLSSRVEFRVRLGHVPALRARVTELATAEQQACAERLLGQLAALEVHADGQDAEHELRFVPPTDCTDLAARALAALEAPAFAAERRRWPRRFVRRPLAG